ncbi:MAG TPA: MarR family winged helix-turn-helix transcriptional regulator [Stellaceae bacterium]|jgi:DNA-binding MarR family transcriptional regulator|nr:MarR family winged helix-turn-helix transcriptional regulator [Stellaceae bacterium]
MDDIYEMPGHLIRRAHQISTAFFAAECAGHDLTSVQYASLSAIGANPGVDATRLSTLIAFDRSTIGDVLERLETKGWILRRPSPLDKRVKLLTLTPAGTTLIERVGPAVQAVQEQIMEPLSPEERSNLLVLLKKLSHVHNNVTSAPQVLASDRERPNADRQTVSGETT